jgi:ribosomal-protein-alanine N-acetyltransferase
MNSDAKPACDLLIRAMTPGDLTEVLAIDREASSLPWSPDTFESELKSSLSRYLVAAADGAVVGYVGFWMVAGEAQIQNVAVRRDWRGRGAASRLLAAMMDMARSLGALSATLEVRSRNESAIRLYGKNGFVVKGVRRRYYDDDGDDALVMGADL